MQNLQSLQNNRGLGSGSIASSVVPNYSIQFDGVNDVVTAPDSAIWDDAVTAFTMECWALVDDPAFNSVQTFIKKDSQWIQRIENSQLQVIVWTSVGGEHNTHSAGNVPTATWTHFATSYDGASIQSYMAGVRVNNDVITGNISFTGSPVLFGFATNEAFKGNLGPMRISKVARYTGATLTVPTAPFTNDANTLALYNMNTEGGTGTTMVDTSGNGLDGVFGAATAAPTWSALTPF